MNDFLFSEEPPSEQPIEHEKLAYLDILIVDDEEGIHQVTKLVLSGVSFENKALRFHPPIRPCKLKHYYNERKTLRLK